MTVTELSNEEYNRLLESRIRELEAALEKYCNCRHASKHCFCTCEARAAMFKNRAEGRQAVRRSVSTPPA